MSGLLEAPSALARSVMEVVADNVSEVCESARVFSNLLM